WSGWCSPSRGCAMSRPRIEQHDPPERVLRRVEVGLAQRDDAFLKIADLRLAAWFLWMTPFEAALSSLRPASLAKTIAVSLSPASAASRNLRTAVLRPDLTALLRW